MRHAAAPFDSNYLRDTYHIVLGKSDTEAFPLSSSSGIRLLIDQLGNELNAPDSRVTGSLFIKRYSPLVAGAIYLWAYNGMALDFSPERVLIALATNGAMRFSMCVDPASVREDVYMQRLFAEHAVPLMQLVTRHTGIRETVLWANLSYLIVYRFREWIRNADSEEERSRLRYLLYRIAEDPPSDWFPGKAAGLLNSRYRQVEVPWDSEHKILVRAKCCLSFRLPGDRYCYTCPSLSDEARIAKYACLHPPDGK